MSDLNDSNHSLTLEDLSTTESAYSRKVPIVRGVFINHGSSHIMVKADVDDSFAEVMKVVEKKTGIPTEEQVLAWNGSGVLIDNNKSLRSYGYMSGGFCTLSSKSS